MNKKNNFKNNNRGITIAALVVTIIVILILSTISIDAIFGENGMLKVAKENKDKNLNTIDSRDDELNTILDKYDNVIQDIPDPEMPVDTTPDTNIIDDGEIEENPTLEVGDTVLYTPPSASYTWQSTYSGASADATLSNTSTNYKITTWRVLNINSDGTVDCIAGAPTTGTAYLGSYNGYNNGVKLLNDACSTLYQDTSKNITARSIKLEDITEKMTSTALDSISSYSNGYTKYNQQASAGYATSSKRNYPTIYASENLSVINGTKNTTGLEISEQTSFTTGKKTASSSIRPYQTYWYKNATFTKTAFSLDIYHTLLLTNAGSDNVWIASRCVNAFNTYGEFLIRYMHGGEIDASYIYWSNGTTKGYSMKIFPIINVDATILTSTGVNIWQIT